MAASLEAFKSFKTVGVVVFADSKKDKESLPKGVMDVRAKGGNTIPMVFITTSDGEKGIDAVPYSDLKADMRKAVRELRKSLEDVDVIGGVDSADEAAVSKEEEKERRLNLSNGKILRAKKSRLRFKRSRVIGFSFFCRMGKLCGMISRNYLNQVNPN